jgi:CubicO group peptidase (beta-lactamase class C family)
VRHAPSDPRQLLRQQADHLARRTPAVVLGMLADPDSPGVVEPRGHLYLPDGPAPTPQTLVEIGSVTKVVTSLALADAVVRGQVALDTRVRDLLPPGTAMPPAGGDAITLEQLSTHTSGLPRSPLGVLAEWRQTHPYATTTVDDVVAALGRTRLRRAPGTGRPAYSNFGAAVLGIALARATGFDTWEHLVRHRVLEPLRLHDTVLLPDEQQSPRVASGHRRRGRPTPGWRLDGLAPAGGLLSCADDMLSFARAQLRPDRTPLADAIRLTQQRRHEHRGSATGLGWAWTETGGTWLLWHNGGTGGFRSFVGLDPARGTAVVVLLTAFSLRGGDLAGVQVLRALAGAA